MSDKKTLTTVPFDAIVDISISGLFLSDLQQCLLHLYELYPDADTKNVFETVAELTNREPQNKWEAHVVTMFILLKEIESKFQEANFTNEKTAEEIEELIKKNSPESSPEN